MPPKILTARRGEEDGALIVLLRHRLFGRVEICPSEDDGYAIVRKGERVRFIVGQKQRVRCALGDRLYRIDLSLGGLTGRCHRTVFDLCQASLAGKNREADGWAVNYRIELQDYRRFFLSHYRMVREGYPFMAEARFSPRDGLPTPNLMSEIGESVASFCRNAMLRTCFSASEKIDSTAFRRYLSLSGQMELELESCGVTATVDFMSLSALPRAFASSEMMIKYEDLDERIEKNEGISRNEDR